MAMLNNQMVCFFLMVDFWWFMWIYEEIDGDVMGIWWGFDGKIMQK